MSRDMDVCSCAFQEEQAFLTSLPLVSMEKHLYERSKRNALTTGVASCYPFTSYEEKQLLDDALIRTYARKGITHDNASLHDPDNPDVYRQMPVLGNLYDVLKEERDTKRLSNIILFALYFLVERQK